jgi:hypothetical protein
LCALLAACGPKPADENDPETAPNAQGGAGGATDEPERVVCPGPNDVVDPTAAIDDLEDNNGAILPVDGRSGGWWTAGDDTLGATIVPPRSDLTGMEATPLAMPEGRCGSSFAMRVTGQGFTEWGAMLGLSLAYGTQPNGQPGAIAYDATGRQGVEFWARIGDTSTNQVRFAIGDSNSEPAGGVCQEDGAIGETCYDSFGVYLTALDVTWRRYRIPFSGLVQRDFGYPAQGVALNALYTITFSFDAGAIFDFWVDDISFY